MSFYIPFEDVGKIHPGEEVRIRAHCLVNAKLTRIVIPPDQAAAFVVTQVSIDRSLDRVRSLLVDSVLLSARFFVANQQGFAFDAPFITGDRIAFTVRNVSNASAICTPVALDERADGELTAAELSVRSQQVEEMRTLLALLQAQAEAQADPALT